MGSTDGHAKTGRKNAKGGKERPKRQQCDTGEVKQMYISLQKM